MGQLNAGQNLDPRLYLDMVSRSEQVEELGTDEIDDEPVTGLAADVRFVDMLAAQGLDADAVMDSIMERARGSEEETRHAMDVFAFPVEVWIDGDGLVRELTIDVGQGITDLAEEMGEEGSVNLSLSTTIDFSDYGDDSIEVVVPDATETVDLTDTFRAMQEELGG